MIAAREQLRRLVEELPEDQVSVALVEMQRLVGDPRHAGLAPALVRSSDVRSFGYLGTS